MNYLVRKLRQQKFIKEKHVFLLEQILPGIDLLSIVEINNIVNNLCKLLYDADQTVTHQEIEECFWDIRRKMLEHPNRGKKLALCILMDQTIEKKYKNVEMKEKCLLKLISTMVVQYI